MKIQQTLLQPNSPKNLMVDNQAALVLCFGDKLLLADQGRVQGVLDAFPNGKVLFCSTSGEIMDAEVYDKTLSITSFSFETTTLNSNKILIEAYENSFDAGAALVKNFNQEGLKYILVISDGSKVNGSELVKGMQSIVPVHIPITGGLAGDGSQFNYTLTGLNEHPLEGRIIAIAFYGQHFRVGHGCLGGWETFGLEKTVTKSHGNQLCEIDDCNALDMYKEYLGKYVDELPGAALLFPLNVQLPDPPYSTVVRTILSIDNEKKSMVFAGDVPVGSKIRFMKANFDRLIDASSAAAKYATTGIQQMEPKFSLLISCVGRKLILGNRTEEEVEAVREMLGPKTAIGGFYSYGEISPLNYGTSCSLHNQTMSITCFDEVMD